jgi:arylsulfatase
VLRPGQSHVNFTSRLTGSDRDFEIRARLRSRRADDSGVLLASGARYGGYALYIQNERLVFEHHLLGERTTLESRDPVPVGDSELGIVLRRHADRSATASLFIGDTANGQTDIPQVALQPAMYGMDVGKDTGGVGVGYAGRVDFTLPVGVLRDVTVKFGGIGPLDELATHLEASQ